MQPFNKKEKLKLLSKLYWDREVDPEHLVRLLDGEIESEAALDSLNLYSRLFTTYDWYTILKLVPLEKLREILDDKIIDQLYPADLKTRLQYARRVLSK